VSACTKVRWFSRRSAQRARRFTPAEHQRAYWCPGCHGWHLGHLPQAVMLGRLSAREVYGLTR
jgi:hypothetical protein